MTDSSFNQKSPIKQSRLANIKEIISNGYKELKEVVKFKREEDALIFTIVLSITIAFFSFLYSFINAYQHQKDHLPYAESLVKQNIINPHSNWKEFRLDEPLTRREFTEVLLNLNDKNTILFGDKSKDMPCTGTKFKDINYTINKTDNICGFIEYLGDKSFLRKEKAPDGNIYFYLSNTISKIEVLKFLLVILNKQDPGRFMIQNGDSKFGDIQGKDIEPYVYTAQRLGIIKPSSYYNISFNPSSGITRGEFFVILSKILDIIRKN